MGFPRILAAAASSMATRRPIIDTMRAASLRLAGIVITGVLEGR